MIKIAWKKTLTRAQEEVLTCGFDCSFYGCDDVTHWCKINLGVKHNIAKEGESKKEAFLRKTFLNPLTPGPECPGPGEYILVRKEI